MKLLRYGPAGEERPGMLDADGTLRDLSGVIDDLNPDNLGPASLDRLRALDPSTLPAVEGSPRMGPCVGRVGKFVCIGLNYVDHAEETGNPIPAEPIIFMKATSAIIGPDDDIVLPRGSEKTDWEVELGIVIGKQASYVEEAHAMVEPPSASHGVLLERPQSREGLAGVADPGLGALELVGPSAGEGGDAGEMAQQIERGPLG